MSIHLSLFLLCSYLFLTFFSLFERAPFQIYRCIMELMSNLGHITETEAKDNKQKKISYNPMENKIIKANLANIKSKIRFHCSLSGISTFQYSQR